MGRIRRGWSWPRVRRNGFALVAVLWFLILLAYLASSFSASSRTSAYLARNLEDAAQAQALADAGVYRAVWGLLQFTEEQPLRADGTVYGWGFDGGSVRFSLQAEAGKIDLNAASEPLLRELFVVAGAADDQAQVMAQAIAEFRDPDQNQPAAVAVSPILDAAGAAGPFLVIDQLQAVTGMTRSLYERVRPSVTIYTGAPQPMADIAPADVRAALEAGGEDMFAEGDLGRNDLGIGGYDDEGDYDRSGLEPLPGGGREAATDDVAADGLSVIEPGEGADLTESLGGVSLAGQIVSIHAEARTAAGVVYARDAIVELGAYDPPFRVFVWRQGDRRYFPRDDEPGTD